MCHTHDTPIFLDVEGRGRKGCGLWSFEFSFFLSHLLVLLLSFFLKKKKKGVPRGTP